MNNTYERPKTKLKVFLETADGEGQNASFFMHAGDKLSTLLNGANLFIEMENEAGENVLVSKSFIWRVTADENAQKTKRESAGGEKWRHHSQDPYILLGITSEATDEQVREAYHAMARAYHPDKLLGLDLPPILVEQGSSIFQKVTAAYKLINEQRRKSSAA